MESFKALIDAHIKARKLEKEIKKERRNLIKEYRNKNSSDSDWDIIKIKYAAFGSKLKEVTATFDKLLDELDNIDTTNIDSSSSYNSEIINNFDNSDSDSSTGSDKEYDTLNLIKNSVPMTDALSVDEPQIKIEQNEQNEQKEAVQTNTTIAPKEKKEEEEIKQQIKEEIKEELKEKEAKTEDKTTEKFVQTSPQKHKKVQKILNGNKNAKKEKEYPTLSNTPPPPKRERKAPQNKRGARISAVRAGYKYKGEGFKVFTGPLNRSRPIFSSTMLFCYETCNNNEQELRNYLIKFGKFKKEMIEEIIFKYSYNNGDYALIKVRGKLSYIKNKIKTLNKAKRNRFGDILSIFERSTMISSSDYANQSNVLYVNNFDLLKDSDHKRFTKLFLQFGELIKDIRMGVDRSRDPYAIIHFREENDAIRAFERNVTDDAKDLMFNGKKLQIQFSKF